MQTPPYNEGYKACNEGLQLFNNPYNENPFRYFRLEWIEGWLACYREQELFSLIL